MTSQQDAARERRQVATMRAYVRSGSIKAAAHELGISPSTARQRLMAYYARIGVQNAVQAAYVLDRPDDGLATVLK